MRYYPTNLNIKNRNCLVVGGGSVDARKVITLVNCSAGVTVVSSVVSENMIPLAQEGKIAIKKALSII